MKKKCNWRCASKGTKNNGLVTECKFEFLFEKLPYSNPMTHVAPHCPVCGTEMEWVRTGKSITELLREGQLQTGEAKK